MMAAPDLVKAFHQEMLAFVDRYVDRTRIFYEEGLENLSDDDLAADKMPTDSIYVRMSEQDNVLLDNLRQRFHDADIGNWDEHMEKSGALDIALKVLSHLP